MIENLISINLTTFAEFLWGYVNKNEQLNNVKQKKTEFETANKH